MLRETIFIFLFLLYFEYADPAPKCTRSSSFVDFESDFTMVQHQLRGHIKIIDCSFRVSQFDMLSSVDVHWWGALAPDFDNLTTGFIVSDHKLNHTYVNSTFVVQLMANITWDMIPVLTVWDVLSASDFGHILIQNLTSTAESPPESDGEKKVNVSVHTEPTMFDNCKVLSKDFRVRWSLKPKEDIVEIGLEGATGVMNYMAFGWANPNATDAELMVGADVAVTGFKEDGLPFVDDFFITKYSECVKNSEDGTVEGVCPDSIYEGPNRVGLVNDTRLIYGHRSDGVSLVRYRRPLSPVDAKYDHRVDRFANMTVIWALGKIRAPDTVLPYYLAQNHGGLPFESFGHLVLNISRHVNECNGPLDAADKEDQDIIIADAKVPLVVTTGPTLHYPDPPNPAKVIYINKKEAPVLRVERGVPVTFSIQSGHDVALYVTSDPIGGNATLRNLTETIYVGGPEAHGV
ncbi:unnamed protein product [Lathyrus sativus]|nr:unnamed protein product [Lathyrus sativus]